MSTTKTEIQLQPVLFVETKTDLTSAGTQCNYAHVSIRIAYVMGFREKVRYFLTHEHELDFEELFATCQIDGQTYPDEGLSPLSYGWHWEYRKFGGLRLQQIEAMQRTLKTLDRKYQSLVKKMGNPLSFGQYCAYIAISLNAKEFVFPARTTGDDERYLDIQLGSSQVDVIVKDLRQKCIDAEQGIQRD